MNLLVAGGDAEQRRQVAHAFHQESPLRCGPFLSVDCERDEQRVSLGLRAWLSADGPDPGANPLGGAQHGTLFLDSVGSLSAPTQRLLLALVNHLGGTAHQENPLTLRIAAGDREDLAAAVGAGIFSSALYDGLDKIRIDVAVAQGAA